jgi:hypothetical protein
MGHFFYEKETVTCGRKEKLENEIGENLSLEKRKKEKRPARRKNSPEMKDDSQDRLRQTYLSAHTRSQYLISRQQAATALGKNQMYTRACYICLRAALWIHGPTYRRRVNAF